MRNQMNKLSALRYKFPIKKRSLWIAVVAILMGASAQSQAATPDSTASKSPAKAMDVTELLSRIHNTNLEEIEVGHLAERRGQSAKVKAYGDRLVKDHTVADKQILELAKNEKIQLHEPVPLSTTDSAKMDMHKQAAAKIKAATDKEFDSAFLAAMTQGHEDAIQMLQSARLGDTNVQRMVDKLVPILKEHHEMAAHLDQAEKSQTLHQ
jgi:putative membrane protein